MPPAEVMPEPSIRKVRFSNIRESADPLRANRLRAANVDPRATLRFVNRCRAARRLQIGLPLRRRSHR